MEEEKKSNKGGKRDGAGRKAGVKVGAYKGGKDYAERKPCMTICGTPTELARIRQKAEEKETSVSRFLIESAGCLDSQKP